MGHYGDLGDEKKSDEQAQKDMIDRLLDFGEVSSRHSSSQHSSPRHSAPHRVFPGWPAVLHSLPDESPSTPDANAWRGPLAAQVALPTGAKVLDVGCGVGGSSRHIARRYPGCTTTGSPDTQPLKPQKTSDPPNPTPLNLKP